MSSQALTHWSADGSASSTLTATNSPRGHWRSEMSINSHSCSKHYVAAGFLINKQSCVTNHSKFLYPCQVYTFEAANHKLNLALKQNIFYEHYTWVLQKVLCLHATSRCVDADWLSDTSANNTIHMECYWLRRYMCASSCANCILVIVHICLH